MRKITVFSALWLSLLSSSGSAAARVVYYENFRPEPASALAAAADAEGAKFAPLPKDGPLAAGAVVLLLARHEGYKVDEPDPLTARLREHVNRGGALVVFPAPQRNYQMTRLAFMLPTTGFMPTFASNRRGAASVAAAAPGFDGALTLSVPWYYEIRQWHAIERGQEKHYIYERPAIYCGYPVNGNKYEYLPPGTWWWTRPLNNRDWQTLATLDDFQGTPLLLSSRYGAGRALAAGADLAALPDSPAARALWAGIFKFLPDNPNVANTAGENFAAKITAAKFDRATRTLTLSVTSGVPQAAEVVLRLLSFEGTMLADQRRELKLSGGVNRVVFNLPPPDEFSPAETRLNDRYLCRVGVLTNSGATLADERTIPADAAPPLTLSVQADEIRRVTAQLFPNTGFTGLPLAQRYGLHIGNYAYRPGGAVNVSVTVRNGVRNLAPLVSISDAERPDNDSVIALTDNGNAMTHKDWYATNGHSYWTFKAATGGRLRCVFPLPVTLEGIELMSGAGTFRNLGFNAPDAVRILADGQRVYDHADTHDAWFAVEKGNGKLLCTFEKYVTAREWVIEFPANQKAPRSDRNVAEIWFWGWDAAPPAAVSGTLALTLTNILSGERSAPVRQPLTVNGSRQVTLPLSLPDAQRAEFYRVDATFSPDKSLSASAAAALPLMALNPAAPLAKAYSELDPAPNSIGLGFIVTRGFRVALPFGTGGQFPDGSNGWGNPDDLIWAYAHGFKEDKGVAPARLAGQLFAADADFRHYITPWRPFASGEEFYAVAAPRIIDRLKQHQYWKTAALVRFDNSDRWDLGPPLDRMNSWQDVVAFDDYLRDSGRPPLNGSTRSELLADIHQHREIEWRRWHLDRYFATLKLVKTALAAEGKEFQLTAQGMPVIPIAQGDEILPYIGGSANDSTWAMDYESPARTYGRQMGVVALAPDLKLRLVTVIHWLSAVINSQQWRGTVATIEPGRRRYLPEYFVGRIHSDGRYGSMHSVAFSENGRNSNRTSEQDYQSYLQMFMQGGLLTPAAPLGAGLVVANDFFNDPLKLNFSFFGDIPEATAVAHYNGVLTDYGYPVSFSARLDTLEKWDGAGPDAPLLVTNPASLTAKELRILEKCERRGSKIIALTGYAFAAEPDAAAAAPPLPLTVSQWFAAQPATRQVVELPPVKTSPAVARAAVAQLEKFTAPRLSFSAGLCGYGFVSNGRNFIVVGDWLEQPRVATLTVRSAARELRAAELTNHRPLAVTKNGDGTFTLALPLSPGDGALMVFDELF